MPDADQGRALVYDFLMKMYAEQSGFFRHYETQRSTATAILTSISAALLGLTGALWTHYGAPDERTLPSAVTLAAVGLAGYVLTFKLFERSRVHHSLAEAYLNSINALMEDDVAACFGARTRTIAYVANAERDFAGKPSKWLCEISFPGGKQLIRPLNKGEMLDLIATHNPVDPRKIAIPVHNASMGRIVSLQTWKLWLLLYKGICVAGLGLTGWSLWHALV